MKISQEQQKQSFDLVNQLIEKAWRDESFKDRLIKNPEEGIQELTGKEFTSPQNKKIVVEDQTNADVIYLNIPAEPNLDDLELTDEQLAQVAGGVTPTVVIAFYCITSLSAGVAVGKAIS